MVQGTRFLSGISSNTLWPIGQREAAGVAALASASAVATKTEETGEDLMAKACSGAPWLASAGAARALNARLSTKGSAFLPMHRKCLT